MMTDLTELLKAAKAAKEITQETITIKYDGYHHTICIGYTSADLQDRAYRAAHSILGAAMGWGGNIKMAADITGHDVNTITTI